ncbi:MobF family relaxase [Corynebacterium bovis]|uniref:MobF family relaxase n=1 Tax=Corynebacterium bovis TaxID=36808 RepID=UPI000F63FD13|nr:MobF family relaxase [Corynebacterium bovis]RRO90223.1 TraA protein [Corynebacterium bovis]
MMSIRAVHAGEGYRYLLRSVATNDADPDAQNTAETTAGVEGHSPTGQVESGDRLSAYYQAKGTPPGRWIGRGVAGLESETVTAGAQVTEDQMAALYGEGLHPDADERIAAGESVKQVQLGRKFPVYSGGHAVLADLAAAEKSFRAEHDRRPTEAERSELALAVGRAHFAAAHDGVGPADGKEVIGWVNRLQDSTTQAVSGFDLTFSPVKSVSVLWALADENTSNMIAAAHHDAVAQALEWVQDNALFTRIGTGGIQQVTTDGLVASEFTHFDTRGGDPDLHSHVLVANKVRVADTPAARAAGAVGQWKTIDSRALHEYATTASGVYNTALQQLLAERLGVEFTAVSKGPEASPVWEVAGVPRSLNEAFSSRRAGAKPVYEAMVADYVDKHGRQPSRRATYRLWQAAILETRDAKRPAESLSDLRGQWREHAQKIVPTATVDGLVHRVTRTAATRPAFSTGVVDQVAAEAIEVTLSRRATFKKSHLANSVNQLLHGYTFASDRDVHDARQQVVEAALTRMAVCLTPPEIRDLPTALTTEAGVGIDRRDNAEIYSTTAQLDRERAILTAADTPAPVFVPSADIDAALDRFTATRGFSLNTGQEAMARHLVTCGVQLSVAVGPAGTGKTTSMKLVTDLWKAQGRQVIGLAPSAAAAAVLAGDIGTGCHTIDALTHAWNQAGEAGLTGADRAAKLPVQIRACDMLLVDEAGMASTSRMADLVDIATATGAVIRMVGDPAQLDAVETGGMFRTLTHCPGVPELTEVMRFGDDAEMANASLAIRAGDTTGLDVLFDRGWVTEGTAEQMLTGAVDGYLADVAAGRSSLCIASTNASVRAMNEMIQHARQAQGKVAETGPCTRLSDGLDAHIGDTVLARKNTLLADPNSDTTGGVRVLNGQRLHVRAVRADGSLDTYDPQAKTPVHLPADYVAKHVQLGYASTAHRAQGATVQTTHAVVDSSMDRNAAYVALTRHKQHVGVYVDTTPQVDVSAEDAHQHHSGDAAAPTARQVLETVVERDTSQRSATDETAAQFDAAGGDDTLRRLYLEGAARATGHFADRTTQTLVESLPVYQAAMIDRDGVEAIEHAIAAAAEHGVDARRVWLDAADDIDWATSPGRLIASRIRHMTENQDGYDTTPGGLPTPPPIIPGADVELADWLAATHTHLTAPTGGPSPAAVETTAAEQGREDTTGQDMLDWLTGQGLLDPADATAAAPEATATTTADTTDGDPAAETLGDAGTTSRPDNPPSPDDAPAAPADEPARPAARTTTERIIAATAEGTLPASVADAALFGAQATTLGSEPTIDLDDWATPATPDTNQPTHDEKDRQAGAAAPEDKADEPDDTPATGPTRTATGEIPMPSEEEMKVIFNEVLDEYLNDDSSPDTGSDHRNGIDGSRGAGHDYGTSYDDGYGL